MIGKNWKHRRQVVVTGVLLFLLLVAVQAASAAKMRSAPHQGVVQQVAPLASITLLPTGDTTLREAHPSTNYGNDNPEELLLGRIEGGRTRALIEFNMGRIPLGATINGATLRVYQHGWYDYEDSTRTISFDRVTSGWHEAVATWNYAPTIGETVGSFNAGMSTGWYAIDVTDLVKAWYAGTAPNYGLLLRGHEGSENIYRRFTPRLYENAPQLIVNYTLQPTTLAVSNNAFGFATDGHKMFPASSILQVSNTGAGVMNWSIDLGATAWLDVSPAGGSTSTSYKTPVLVSVLTDTLSVGAYTAPITITASGAQSSPQVVQVTVYYSSNPLADVYLPLVLHNTTGDVGPVDDAQTVALLVGIADYEYLVPPPSASVRTGDWGHDLAEIDQNPDHVRKSLLAFGNVDQNSVRALKDAEASKMNIAQGFQWVDDQEQKAISSESVAAFVYGGHGGQDTGDGYLITAYDTGESGGHFTNAITGAQLDAWLDDLDSPQILVVIDSCQSGGLLADLQQPGRVIITSADSTHSAWESGELNGGVFTYYFVQALFDPAADTNGDGWVSAEEAYNYAHGLTDAYTTRRAGAVQNPQMYDGVPGSLKLTKPAGSALSSVVPFSIVDDGELPEAFHFTGELIRRPVHVSTLK